MGHMLVPILFRVLCQKGGTPQPAAPHGCRLRERSLCGDDALGKIGGGSRAGFSHIALEDRRGLKAFDDQPDA
jgi:hypothetical protein